MADEFNVHKICTEILLNDEHFLAGFQKATFIFVMSVCAFSDHMEFWLPQDGIL